MTLRYLSLLGHGEIAGIGEVGFYDELFFFFAATILLIVVGMSWFFTAGNDEEEMVE